MGLHVLRTGRRRIGARLITCALLAGSAVGLSGLAQPARAAANEVLILGATVSGGTNSLEAQEITSQGFTPVVVDDATWEGMTTAQFASYRAIVIGDPTCGNYDDTSHFTAALSHPGTWGAAVNGNVLIIGTDPVFHSGGTLTSGPGKLIAHGIDFALAQSGKTGAYIDLSCAYGEMPANTPVTLLDGLRSGGFTVDGTPSSVCYNDAHIVATHPALTGLTDADLSNWSCSVHESFDTWPGDYTVLAMARNFGSTYTASDGTVGEPYILASGTGLHSFPLSLDPLSQTKATGGSATVTAQLLDATTGLPVSGTTISFRIESGPNGGTTGTCSPSSCITDSAGQVQWTYTGARPGTDTVQAWIDQNGNGQPSSGEPQTTAAVTWTGPQGYVAMGDSYSSGEGLSPYESPTDTSSDHCHRSDQAYGPRVDSEYSMSPFTFVACSGAVTQDLFASNHSNAGEPAQIHALKPDTAFITFTIGGNDAGFASVLNSCIRLHVPVFHWVGGYGCSKDKKITGPLQTRLAALAGSGTANTPDNTTIVPIVSLLLRIHQLSPQATIEVGGYPHLFGSSKSSYESSNSAPSKYVCKVGAYGTAPATVDYQDAQWLNSMADKLDGVIQSAVTAAVARGVPAIYVNGVEPDFAGHGLCDSSAPWVNGLSVNATGPNSWSFHPTATGQSDGYEVAFGGTIPTF
jgi:hypothetical protein